ncbi:MAG: phosphotransferase [Dehalococcoidia bacterium]
MQEEEIALPGGTHGPVVRVGDTVRRISRPSTPAVHSVLRHLEAKGFDGSPRALGFDEQGREVLSFVAGEVGLPIRERVLPVHVRDETTLAGVARLLRGLHDATLDFLPPADAAWASLVGGPRSGEVICHNDVGPYNTVFVDGHPTAFIDWDEAAPAPRLWDVAYALYRFVPFLPDEICSLIGWPEPPDRARRTQLFCDAYGLEQRSGLMETAERRVDSMIATGLARNAAREPKYGDEWLRVMKPRLVRDLEFVRSLAPL